MLNCMIRVCLVRICQTLFQKGSIILYSHQQWMRVPVVSHPRQCVVVSAFGVLTLLIGMCLSHCFSLLFPDDQ